MTVTAVTCSLPSWTK